MSSSATSSFDGPTEKLLFEFEAAAGLRARTDVYARDLTTYQIGGPIAAVVEPQNILELSTVIRFLHEAGESFRVIGGGSNLLVSDTGIAEWVIRLGKGFREVKQTGSATFEVGAGKGLMSLSRETAELGLAGLEFAGGIPATIGGAVFMNAGAHGGEMQQVITCVHCVTAAGEVISLRTDECGFSYRHSALPTGSTVYAAELRLVESDRERVTQARADNLSKRKAAQPLSYASAGSVFKNPPTGPSAGLLISDCGLKGTRIGGAIVSAMHGNWILNEEKKATAQDVEALIKLCQERVLSHHSVQLVSEIIRW